MKILQISTALPKKGYTTEELTEAFPCKLPEGVRQNIANLGVKKRYLIDQFRLHSKSETPMDETELVNLCTDACKQCLQKASLSTRDVDYFVAAYDVNPFLSPGLSQLLIRDVGFNPYIKYANAQGIASTAFSKALELAGNHLAAHPKDTVLVCVSGVSSYWFQNQVGGLSSVMEISKANSIKNRNQRAMELRKWVAIMQYFLFGDGAAAAIVAKRGSGLIVKKTAEATNISRRDYLAGCSRLTHTGEPFRFGFQSHLSKDIPKLGVKYTGRVLRKLLGKNAENTIKTAKKWAVHTGSEKILNALAEHNNIQSEKLAESHQILREYGNLAGASLPFILERINSHTKFSSGDLVLMVGYGWGFSASATLLEHRE